MAFDGQDSPVGAEAREELRLGKEVLFHRCLDMRRTLTASHVKKSP